MTLLLTFALLAYVLLDAVAQGLLTRLTREWVPAEAQAAVNVPLHYLYPAAYTVLVLVAAAWAGWVVGVAGVLLRLALFNPVLNLVKGDTLFAVGDSSWLDKLLRWLSLRGKLANILLRVAALAALIVLLVWF